MAAEPPSPSAWVFAVYLRLASASCDSFIAASSPAQTLEALPFAGWGLPDRASRGSRDLIQMENHSWSEGLGAGSVRSR